MTIPSGDARSGPYNTNGSTVVFPYDFKILDESHVLVTKRDLATGVEETLTIDDDYTVDGVGSDSGGDITTTVTYDTGYSITNTLNVPFEQETDLTSSSGFPPSTLEAAYDLSCQRDKQIQEVLDRCVKVATGSTTSPDDMLDDISDAVVAAQAAQAAAETAQGLAEDAQTGAETAQGLAEDAQSAAETAQGLAEDAQAAAKAAVDAYLTPRYVSLKSWASTTAYTTGNNDYVVPSTPNGYIYQCATSGTSAGSEPSWPTTPGGTVTDGTVEWECVEAVDAYHWIVTQTGTAKTFPFVISDTNGHIRITLSYGSANVRMILDPYSTVVIDGKSTMDLLPGESVTLRGVNATAYTRIARTYVPVMVYASSDSGQVATGVDLQYEDEESDTHSAWSTDTFTAPADGIYEISVSYELTTAPTSQYLVTRKNGADHRFSRTFYNQRGSWMSVAILLVAGDAITFVTNATGTRTSSSVGNALSINRTGAV